MRELCERLAAEQHDEGLLANQHAGGGLIGEPRVVGEAKAREERLAALEVGDGDAHEQHVAGVRGSRHGGPPVGDSMAYALRRPVQPAELIGGPGSGRLQTVIGRGEHLAQFGTGCRAWAM